MKIFSVIVELVGVVFLALGLVLGVADGDTLGGMVGVVLGISVIAMGAFILEGNVF